MLTRLLAALIIAASLSASDATPGQRLTLSVGVENCAGPITVDPAQGVVIGASAPLTSTLHTDRNLPVAILPGALPGLRRLVVRCGEASAVARVYVHGVAKVFVPVATKSPAD